MRSPALYDHYHPSDADYPDGTYRVVGVDDERATLVHVADADGRRVNSGTLVKVSAEELDGFSTAPNPDGNLPVGAAINSTAEMVHWSIRVFLAQLTEHPLSSSIAVLVILIGSFGDDVLLLSVGVKGGLIIVGSLGLAIIGSGRLSR